MVKRKISKLTEMGLIKWLEQESFYAKGLILGVGDDAAVVSPERRGNCLLKTDMVIEDVHFTSKTNPREWARKVVMANISDIAAMGGTPRWCMVALGIPSSYSMKKAKAIGSAALAACKEYGVTLVGGDTSRSLKAVMAVAMTGRVAKGREIRRSGARVGDIVFVTGALGGSLISGRHLSFVPRLKESRFLVENYRINSMIDVSDGLSKDLRLIAEASSVGLRINLTDIPLHDDVADVRQAFFDGEDYELVFAMRSSEAIRLMKDDRWRRRGFIFSPIGKCVRKSNGLGLVDKSGRVQSFPKIRDHHFAL